MTKLIIHPKRLDILDTNDEACQFRINIDVLNEADILISDFSGVVFDFSLVFNKPVIYTEPSMDWSQ